MDESTEEMVYERKVWLCVNRWDWPESHSNAKHSLGVADIQNDSKKESDSEIYTETPEYSESTSTTSGCCQLYTSHQWAVKLRSDMNGETVKTLLRALFHIHGHDLLLRVRRSNGNLIAINGQMPENTSDTPHILEVIRMYQSLSHKKHSYNERINDLTKRKLEFNMQRLDNLERALSESQSKQEMRVKNEFDEIEKKLIFLNQRFEIAESMNWKGMFHRHPFW